MAVTDTIQRAAPFVVTLIEDGDFTDHLRRAGTASRKAVTSRKAPSRRSPRQRVAEAVREAGRATFRARRLAEQERRRKKRQNVLRVGLAGGGAAALAVVAKRRASGSADPGPAPTVDLNEEPAIHG